MEINGKTKSSSTVANFRSNSNILQCKNLYAYLKTLSVDLLDQLYKHPSTCLAVYRELPELARQYVIRILFVEQPVPQAVIASWVSPSYSADHEYVSNILNELNVWQEYGIPGGLLGWSLNTHFKKNLKVALLGGGKPWIISSQLEANSKGRDIGFLDTYALERWECVLHYMVSSQQQLEGGISAEAVRILLHADLMRKDEHENSFSITRKGFQFLLLDIQTQIWHFILQYLDTVEHHGLDLCECLTFLFQLSFSTLGKDYSTEGLKNSRLQIFLQHLREFGLVYQRKRKAGRFYPTRLVINIASSRRNMPTNFAVDNRSKSNYIIVETNYRVYAHTNSNLQVALLGLFTDLLYRFPSLVVGMLTRDSVRQAFRSGITAEQIVDYLKGHAHPEMLKRTLGQNADTSVAGSSTSGLRTDVHNLTKKSPLPLTVIDQIKLWELERNRLQFMDGVLYNQFLSQNDYNSLRDHAQSTDSVIWSNDKTRVMIVSKTGHDDVKKFWKRYSKSVS